LINKKIAADFGANYRAHPQSLVTLQKADKGNTIAKVEIIEAEAMPEQKESLVNGINSWKCCGWDTSAGYRK